MRKKTLFVLLAIAWFAMKGAYAQESPPKQEKSNRVHEIGLSIRNNRFLQFIDSDIISSKIKK